MNFSLPFDRIPLASPVLIALFGAGLLLASADKTTAAESEPLSACATAGIWVDPGTGENLTTDQILADLSGTRIVLLGENHANAEHHRWQLHTMAGLHARHSHMVVGFEMFPRSVQGALDAWSQGETSEAEFLADSRWQEVWRYDPALYLPLFHFVRQNRLPMTALNVERDLVSRVGQEGWEGVPIDAREGLSDPAPASEAYREVLAQVYAAKQAQGLKAHSGDQEDNSAELSRILSDPGFDRFVEAQLTWDRAMAEALLAASRVYPEAVIVGIVGSGHLEQGHGIPHQLKDLGEESVAVLLPMETAESCDGLAAGLADGVFLVAAHAHTPAPPAKPRLGVMIEDTPNGVRVLEVIDDSIAQATGLLAGDMVETAAGFPVSKIAELIEIIQRQAPGTLLPLQIQRDGEIIEFVAEFPTAFE